MTKNIRQLRSAFDFSKSDARAKRDKRFVKEWRRLGELHRATSDHPRE